MRGNALFRGENKEEKICVSSAGGEEKGKTVSENKNGRFRTKFSRYPPLQIIFSCDIILRLTMGQNV